MIEKSSRGLPWKGVLLEKGWSPHFYPTDVVTPYFYFALAVEKDLRWQVEGGGRFRELKTTPGEIWVNPPWTPFTHRIDEACFFIILAIEESTMQEGLGGDIPLARLQFLNNYNVVDEYLRRFIELLYVEVCAEGANGPTFAGEVVGLLCRYYAEHYSDLRDLRDQTTRPAASRLRPEQVQLIRRYIAENIGEMISIEELAAEVNLSRFYFLKEFKKATGRTPYQFLTELRMEQAATWIRTAGLDLAEIALRLGFADQSHFGRVFKRHFDMTPGAFRRLHAKGIPGPDNIVLSDHRQK